MRRALTLSVALWVAGCGGPPPLPADYAAPGGGALVRVPEDHPTIQAGVDAAGDGDTVLVAPGFYFEKVRIVGKRIDVASWYAASKDPEHRNKTVVSGRGAAFEIERPRDAPGEVSIVGFTLRNAKFGVRVNGGAARVEANRIYGNADHAILGNETRLTVIDNEIRDHREGAGISLNGASTLLAEDNVLDRNRIGLLLSLHPYEGEILELRVRGNRVRRSQMGGVMLLPYGGESDRRVWIERNVFDGTLEVAVGCRDRRPNVPASLGVEMHEAVFVVHNTFVNNAFGVVGGDNVVAMNNLFVDTAEVALLRLEGESRVDRNGFWSNGLDEERVPRSRHLRRAEPRIGDDFRLEAGSPAIDAGSSAFTHQGAVVLPVGSWEGEAPDLGAFER